MRRAAIAAAVFAAATTGAATKGTPGAGASPAATAAATPRPARLLVEAREFNLVLSRGTVKAGGAIVQLANRGEDPHDLSLRRVGGGSAGAIGETLPGEVGEWDGRLRRGRYRVFCTLEGHRGLGMRATLRVR